MYRAPEKPYARIGVNALYFLGARILKNPHNIGYVKAVKPCWGLLLLVRMGSNPSMILPIPSDPHLPIPSDPHLPIPRSSLTYTPILTYLYPDPSIADTYLSPAITKNVGSSKLRQRFCPLGGAHRSQTKACINDSAMSAPFLNIFAR